MIKNYAFPEVPFLLLLYDALIPRMNVSSKEKQKREQMYKGFVGEYLFKNLLPKNNTDKAIPLFDLRLEAIEAEFQVDALLICADTIYLFEVKNYTGNYYVHHDKVFSMKTKKEIYDPFLQLDRSTYFFKSFLSSMKINMNVQSYVVFINNQFTLYQAPPHLSMLLPTQVKQFLKKLYANARPIHERHAEMAEMICAKHKEQSSYTRLPKYEFDVLRRGVFCFWCERKLERRDHFHFICPNCNYVQSYESAILRAIAEFRILFPEKNITPLSITRWCGDHVSIHGVRKVLQRNLKRYENGRFSFYQFAPENAYLSILKARKYNELNV